MKTKEIEVPKVVINKIYTHLPLSEQASEFLTQRGDWQKLQEECNWGEGVTVGVGDTGVDKTHLEGDLKGVVNAKDFTGSRNGFYDMHSHGSHTTGHITARGDGAGMIGLAPRCRGLHAKNLGDSGSGSTSGITRSLGWLADEGAEVINLSLGGGFSADIEGACRELSQQGILINASMGNSGTRGDGHPGNSRYTFGIVAVDFNRRIAGFSSRSRMAKYSGYGVNVLSCGTGGRYMRMSGTSMACPDFTGICVLILGYMKKHGIPKPKSMEEWERVLLPGLEDLGTPGHDIEYGYGWIDIWKVLAALKPAAPAEKISGFARSERGRLFIIGRGEAGSFEMKVTGTVYRGMVAEY